MDSNRFYYHATSTGARRVYLLLKSLDLVLPPLRVLDEGDDRYVLKEQEINEWECSFLRINPSGRLPTLEIRQGEDKGLIVNGAQAASEYVLERYYEGSSLLGTTNSFRASVRSFVHYIDEVLEQEAVAPILKERLSVGWDVQRDLHTLDSEKLKMARANLRRHLEYFEYILVKKPYLVGHQRTLADVAASASLTLLDYLGEIAWKQRNFEHLRAWYLLQKGYCRDLLNERIPKITPPENYNRLQV